MKNHDLKIDQNNSDDYFDHNRAALVNNKHTRSSDTAHFVFLGWQS